MSNIIKYGFQGNLYSFQLDGWINATEAAARFGKEPFEWLRSAATARYMEALGRALGFEPGKSRNKLIRTSRVRGQAGTWLHPKMAVAFARWLSDDFGVWCDLQIDAIIRNGIRAEGNVDLIPLLLRPAAAVWERRFPPSYYHALARATNTRYLGHANGTPACWAYITDRWVYKCILPADVYDDLRARREESEKMHQWLTDDGREMLDKQIALVTNIAASSADFRDFEARMMAVSQQGGQLGFVFPKAA